MHVDLVNVTTSDGMRLDGGLQLATGAEAGKADVLLCLHGVGGNFYGSSLFGRMAPRLLESGVAVLQVNTRGHDTVHNARLGPQAVRQGAAYERVDRCTLDIAAWLDFLRQQGFRRPGILGHSLGAIKALYSESQQAKSAACCLIAASPPRLSYSAFRVGPASTAFSASIAEAERCQREKRDQELIEVTVPFPMLITASGYLDKYGSGERYNILRFANRVQPETLFTYGSRELDSGNVAFAGLPQALASLDDLGQRFTFATIEGADHNYTGKDRELVETVLDWLLDDKDEVDA